MGIRLRKRLGYGFTDLEKNDPRIGKVDPWGKVDTADYRSWLKDMVGSDSDWLSHGFGYEESTSLNLYDIITFIPQDDEFEMENGKGVFLLTPPMLTKEASRFDETMDYADYQHYHPELMESMTGSSYEMHSAPFPYSSSVMDVNTKEFIASYEILRYLQKDEEGREDTIVKFLAEQSLKRTPYSSLEELEASTKIVPPTLLRSFTTWLRLFPNPSTWEDMKPYVVTYFS